MIVAIGFFILGYILDAVANPLTLALPTPYHFFTSANISTYPFTTTSIVLKALGVVMGVLIVLASLGLKRFIKGAILLVLSGLLQLYALQDVASRAAVVPLEWALGFTLAGLLMFLPILIFFFTSLFESRNTLDESAPFDDQLPS